MDADSNESLKVLVAWQIALPLLPRDASLHSHDHILDSNIREPDLALTRDLRTRRLLDCPPTARLLSTFAAGAGTSTLHVCRLGCSEVGIYFRMPPRDLCIRPRND